MLKGPLGPDGCVIDFADLKKAVRSVCRCVRGSIARVFARWLDPWPCWRLPTTWRVPHTTVPFTPPACRSMDELFLCPLHSKTCKVVVGSKQVELTAQDGSYFSFPLQDCLLLPLENSTVEELSVYFAQRLVAALGKQILDERQISSLTVGIAETPGQEARYTMALSAR